MGASISLCLMSKHTLRKSTFLISVDETWMFLEATTMAMPYTPVSHDMLNDLTWKTRGNNLKDEAW